MTTTDRFDGDDHHDQISEVVTERMADHAVAEQALTGTNEPHHSEILQGLELKAILESLLFVSHEPLTVDRLAAVLDVSKSETRQTMMQLQQECDAAGRGLQIVEVAGGFQLTTRSEHASWIKQLGKSKPVPKLSRSGLESLAIIAYKQPIVRAEIEQIRGVETSGVLRTLLERKLVRMVGRKDVPGRPIMYGTTKYFLQHFGLRDLSALPPLREFKELGDSEQAMLLVEDDACMVSEGERVLEGPESADSMSPEPAEHI